MRIAIIGYGTVAAIHAQQLQNQPEVFVTAVCGPNKKKSQAFAAAYGIPQFTDQEETISSLADGVLICSPSRLHFAQASYCIKAGLDTLVELPPCESLEQAEQLGALAAEYGVVLQCAHTSRYLSPYKQITAFIAKGNLGDARQISYLRYHLPQERTWKDDALLHHAAHPIDLILQWFGGLNPQSSVAMPHVGEPRTISLLGTLPNGAPTTITVSYDAHLPRNQMLIVGDKYTIETDGFSYVESNAEELKFRVEGEKCYEEAIGHQDMEFIKACQKKNDGYSWQETVKLMRVIGNYRHFQTLNKNLGWIKAV